MTENMKSIKVSVTPELANRYKLLRNKSKDLKVSIEPLEASFENNIKRAMDLFEINHLEPQGHELSPKLKIIKSRKQNGIEKALKSREERRLSVAEASSHPNSIHHFIQGEQIFAESDEASVKDFNRKLKKLASVVSVVTDDKCQPRKLKAGVNDLVLENGWSNVGKVVQRVFNI